MIYNYTISAHGAVDDKKIKKALTGLNLEVDCIEKLPDLPSFILDQPSDETPDLIEKWKLICERKVINRPELEEEVLDFLEEEQHPSRRALAEAIQKACSNRDISDGTTALILLKVMENL